MADKLRLLATAVPLALSGYLVVCGFYLLSEPQGGADLGTHSTAEQYVLRGMNPFDVYESTLAGQRHDALKNVVAVDPGLGVPNPSYPPWTFFTELAFLWPADFNVAKLCYAAANAFLLGYMAWWLASANGFPKRFVPFALAATFAADTICTTLAFGQLGILTVGCLLLAYRYDLLDRPIPAGLFLGLALIKPTLSGPFVLAFLVRRRWKALAIAAGYLAVGSAVVWAITGTDPIRMYGQMERSGYEWGITSYTGRSDAVALFAELGLSPRQALRVSVSVSVGLALAAMWLCRRASPMVLFAIAGVVGRLWVFHFHYDDVILLFVLFGLMEALRDGYSKVLAIALGVLGMTLWFPQFELSGLLGTNPLWGNLWFDRFLLSCQVGSLNVLVVHSRRAAGR